MEKLDIIVCSWGAVLFILALFLIIKFKKKLIPFLSLLVAVVSVSFYFVYKVDVQFNSLVLELGDSLSEDPLDYLSGVEFAKQQSLVDITDVNRMKVGEYEVYIKHAWQVFAVDVTVVDTTTPDLEVKTGDIYLLRGQDYGLDEFYISSFDLSGDVSVGLDIKTQKQLTDYVCYSECGEKSFEVVAEDINGNVTRKTVKVIVDDPPKFSDLPDYYVATNQDVDYLEKIQAYDDVDGDVTGDISVDITKLKPDVQGDYVIEYTVTDSYGLTASLEKTIHIYEPNELQNLIAYHDINFNDDYIVGALNARDAGLFPGNTIDETLEILGPCFVRIRYDYSNGGWLYGSGYIVEFTDDAVVFATCGHVVKDFNNMDIYFHDGSKIQADVIGHNGSKGQTDVAFLEITYDKIPENLLSTLMTVHIDEAYYDSLPASDRNLSIGYRADDEKGEVWRQRNGYYAQKYCLMPGYENWGYLTESTAPQYPGTSGSAIVTAEGYLVAMVSCTYRYDDGSGFREHSYGTALCDILTAYRNIYGRELYTHVPVAK